MNSCLCCLAKTAVYFRKCTFAFLNVAQINWAEVMILSFYISIYYVLVSGCWTDGLLMTSSACFGRLISWLMTWGGEAEDRRTQGESRRVCSADPFLHTRLGIISWWEDFHNSASVPNRCAAWWCADRLHCVCGFPLLMNIGMFVTSVWEKRNDALHSPMSHLVLPVVASML